MKGGLVIKSPIDWTTTQLKDFICTKFFKQKSPIFIMKLFASSGDWINSLTTFSRWTFWVGFTSKIRWQGYLGFLLLNNLSTSYFDWIDSFISFSRPSRVWGLCKEALIAPQLLVFFFLQVDASITCDKKKSLQKILEAS